MTPELRTAMEFSRTPPRCAHPKALARKALSLTRRHPGEFALHGGRFENARAAPARMPKRQRGYPVRLSKKTHGGRRLYPHSGKQHLQNVITARRIVNYL
jgi:hypothetical protein